MNKLFATILFIFFPAIAFAAEGSLSFAPPASDYSVVFLGNLFGNVDGVLHGSGSQIMGTMFAVFNSAVLALGGIIIMYTLMVSTMNTAHEGQMLGQKWSSIWIPVRSTAGLALLIPKASGYCLMQVFIMWIVLQGVGAADKIWNAALDYLNRGGVIIRAEPPDPAGGGPAGSEQIRQGAAIILSGQVCMLGLQKALEQQRQDYLKAKENKAGPCNEPSSTMQPFCDNAVPDFINSVNTISAQRGASSTQKQFQVSMPNFDTNSHYSFLNGICGDIQWNALTAEQLAKIQSIASTSQSETIEKSRTIGIQQMYMDLSAVARIMVNNNPLLNPPSDDDPSKQYSSVAMEQFGIPYSAANTPCNPRSEACVTWGLASGSGAVLFRGVEFKGAISDYNGILAPSMNLISQASKGDTAKNLRNFINNAETQGWIMAGSYFFQLVALNGTAADSPSTTMDTTSGLNKSTFKVGLLTDAFGQSGTCKGTYTQLCTWFNAKADLMENVQNLINGAKLGSTPVSLPTHTIPATAVKDNQSSTVFGFINNSLVMKTPGQPGLDPAFTFADTIHVDPDMGPQDLEAQTFDCGAVKILFFKFCLGRMLGDLFYNVLFRFMYNIFMIIIGTFIQQVVFAIVVIPLQAFAYMFKQGVQILSVPGINPIVALAVMGTSYINFAGDLWIKMLILAATPLSIILMPLFALGMPLVIAWTGVMVSIGFTTAYYVPLLPYMIFTFGTIAWLMAVIEAMVAGPLVALGVTHPEGHEAFGKGEQAIMILMNVFLRPSMMIIGYIAAIALSYVGVWVLNMGFQNAVSFMQPPGPPPDAGTYASVDTSSFTKSDGAVAAAAAGAGVGATAAGYAVYNAFMQTLDSQSFKPPGGDTISGGYKGWAGLFSQFFAVLSYTMAYLIIVQKAFGLINSLPDKVLRWIGGQPEGVGQEAERWGEEAKGKVGEASKSTQDTQTQMGKTQLGKSMKAIGAAKGGASSLGSGGGDISGGPSSKPSAPD